MWLTDRQFFMLAVLCYGVSMVHSIFLWRKGFRQDNRINYCLFLAGFGFHTIALLGRGFRLDHCPVNNLYEATTFVIWTMVGIYLGIGLLPRLRFLGAFASPVIFCIGVFAMFPALDQQRGPTPDFTRGLESIHAALFVLSYGAFGLSSCAALMYLTQEHDLKFHKLRAVFSLMPSIQRLELVTGRLLVVGFVLLTMGLLSSMAFLKHTKGYYYSGDFKIMWTWFVWALYLTLVVLHWRFAQRGRRFAWGALGAFLFVLLTFWGSNLMSTLHNPPGA